jgi:positive regulator of sigma E activity
MQETGRILRLDAKHAVLAVTPHDPGRCGSCGCCGGAGATSRELVLNRSDHPELADARESDAVVFRIDAPNAGVAAAILFGLPLICLGAGALLAWHVTRSETGAILGGGAGFFLGGAGVWLAGRLLQRAGRGVRIESLRRSGVRSE